MNPDYTASFWYYDSNGMILERLGYGEDGIHDAVGRNAFEYICRPNEPFLKSTIMQCVKQRDDSYVQFYRYPDRGADTMSRDHAGAIILALYINRDQDELSWILNNLPWRLSRKHSQTIDFWIWQRALKGKSFILSQVFFILTLIQFILIIPWNWLIRTILSVKKVDPHNNPKWVKFRPKSWKWYLQKTLYPHYALFFLAWQLKVVRQSWFGWIVRWFVAIESGNIVIDALLKGSMPETDWKSYKPTTSFIWSRRMDSSDDVYIVPMSEERARYNDLNRSMIDYLHFGIDKIMLKYPDSIVRSIKNKEQIITY